MTFYSLHFDVMQIYIFFALKGLCQLVIVRTGDISWRYTCQNSIVPRRNAIRNRTQEHVQNPRDMIITITCR